LIVEGKTREARAILEEIIRSAPNVPDPYVTLTQCYEAEGKLEKVRRCQVCGMFQSSRT
jgi:Tfp pilus assembly protein PilF